MLRTFNCGVGMLAAVAADDAQRLVDHLIVGGETAAVVGTLMPRGDEPVTFEHSLSL
jgi:phosphoribosylformylglycinamidine cyclo-ligase